MLVKDAAFKVIDQGRKAHFSKQTILEVVRAVERSATRRELINRYGMAKSTLCDCGA